MKSIELQAIGILHCGMRARRTVSTLRRPGSEDSETNESKALVSAYGLE